MSNPNSTMKIIGFVKVIGDGSKYVEHEGNLMPIVSRSATERLKHGDTIYAAIFDNGYADICNNEQD